MHLICLGGPRQGKGLALCLYLFGCDTMHGAAPIEEVQLAWEICCPADVLQIVLHSCAQQ